MPRGKFLSEKERENIWYHRKILQSSPLDIWDNLFQSNKLLVSLRYIQDLCSQIDSGYNNESFIGCEIKHLGGPKKIIDSYAQSFLLDIWNKRTQTKQSQAVNEFSLSYYGHINAIDAPSRRTIGRCLRANSYSRKVMERVHYLQDPIQIERYMNNVAPISYTRLINIDETLSTAKEYLQKYGISPIGKKAIRPQFRINGIACSAIVAYSPMGVLAYRVVEGTINSIIVQSFIEVELAQCILEDTVGLFDNARIHHTAQVRDSLENIFHGNYLFLSAYCPFLAPVEKLFSVVKGDLRNVEDQAILDPVAYISNCFDQFRPGMPRARMAENHFRVYRDNHNFWLVRNGI